MPSFNKSTIPLSTVQLLLSCDDFVLTTVSFSVWAFKGISRTLATPDQFLQWKRL